MGVAYISKLGFFPLRDHRLRAKARFEKIKPGFLVKWKMSAVFSFVLFSASNLSILHK